MSPEPTPASVPKAPATPPAGAAAAAEGPETAPVSTLKEVKPPEREMTGVESAPLGPSRRSPHSTLRAPVVFLILLILVAGFVYPGTVTVIAQTVTPWTANGSLIDYPNGTAEASALLGQNITNNSLFWLRPSLLDYLAYPGGGDSPYGPSLPALVNLTKYYVSIYGFNNTTVPLDLVSPSASGLDPDLYPNAALYQVPRVAYFVKEYHLNPALTQANLTELIQSHIVEPVGGLLGPAYVNMIKVDLVLIGEEQLPYGSAVVPGPAT